MVVTVVTVVTPPKLAKFSRFSRAKGFCMGKTQVAVNGRGYRIGETHHRAKLTDAEIETILELRDAGLTYAAIAAKWDEVETVNGVELPGKRISKSTVRDVLKGRIRGQLPERYKACG